MENIKITFSKVKGSVIENGKRIVKVLQFGAKTAKESYPFGFDSSAPDDLTAVYAETSNAGDAVVIGYINRNQVAALGESRVYAVDAAGEVVSFVFCRNSGVLELNGSDYSGVRFQELKTATDNANTLLNAELVKVQAALVSLGGAYARLDVSTNLTATESPTVKLK